MIASDPTGPPLRASASLLAADVLGVPYGLRGSAAHDGWHAIRGSRGALWWPRGATVAACEPAFRDLDGVTVFARTLDDEALRSSLPAECGRWAPLRASPDGERGAASVWRASNGDAALPFDPDEVLTNLWSERYARGDSPRGRARRVATAGYYAVRPLLPRAVQISLRRAFARVQSRATFPRWPLEPAAHDLLDLLLGLLAGLVDGPLPNLAPWPQGHDWALVLTHDVETARGRDNLERVRAVEAEMGYRSSWNFVPLRYEVPLTLVDELWSAGCEVGVHGLRHDGRDLGSLETLEERLPAIRDFARRWRAVGFRSPATQRRWEWMPSLGFDYDSSYPDADLFEPQPGGCCSWLPIFNADLVELPITLPQDHTLFVILRQDAERVWIEKAEEIRRRGGMVLLNTHPDYLRDPDRLETYRRFLAHFSDDSSAWKALPHEVASWWRRRSASQVAQTRGEWYVRGPASDDARIRFAPGGADSGSPGRPSELGSGGPAWPGRLRGVNA